MQRVLHLFITIMLLIFIYSCTNDPENSDNNQLGGDSSIGLGEVGNTAYTVVEMNGNYTRLDGLEITKNDNGIVNVHISTDISQVNSNLSNLAELITTNYPGFTNQNGKVSADLKFKITSEGIQDFLKDDKAHTLVKYDCNVGDTYTLQLSNGETIKRKVVAKSDKDDFQWGMMYIKTITVEQNTNVPGIQKYILRANHKFGLVYAEAIMEDGSSIGMYVYPNNY